MPCLSPQLQPRQLHPSSSSRPRVRTLTAIGGKFGPGLYGQYGRCVPVCANSSFFSSWDSSNPSCLPFYCSPTLRAVLGYTYRRRFRGQSAKGKPKGRGTGKEEPENRTSLANIRVVQRNLVYVTNLSLDVAKEEVCV